MKAKDIMLILSMVGTVVLGFVWIDNRYQSSSAYLCHVAKSVTMREFSENEIRLEFYNKELLKAPTGILASTTLSIQERQKVLAALRDSPC